MHIRNRKLWLAFQQSPTIPTSKDIHRIVSVLWGRITKMMCFLIGAIYRLNLTFFTKHTFMHFSRAQKRYLLVLPISGIHFNSQSSHTLYDLLEKSKVSGDMGLTLALPVMKKSTWNDLYESSLSFNGCSQVQMLYYTCILWNKPWSQLTVLTQTSKLLLIYAVLRKEFSFANVYMLYIYKYTSLITKIF